MMTTVEYLSNTRDAAKARAQLDTLDQAWAYYTPEKLPEQKNDAPTDGFLPYYDAA